MVIELSITSEEVAINSNWKSSQSESGQGGGGGQEGWLLKSEGRVGQLRVYAGDKREG